jgi:hypothetical protein
MSTEFDMSIPSAPRCKSGAVWPTHKSKWRARRRRNSRSARRGPKAHIVGAQANVSVLP